MKPSCWLPRADCSPFGPACFHYIRWLLTGNTLEILQNSAEKMFYISLKGFKAQSTMLINLIKHTHTHSKNWLLNHKFHISKTAIQSSFPGYFVWFFFKTYFIFSMYLCVSLCACKCQQRPEEGSPEARVPGSCEPPLSAGNWTGVFCQSTKHPSLLTVSPGLLDFCFYENRYIDLAQDTRQILAN